MTTTKLQKLSPGTHKKTKIVFPTIFSSTLQPSPAFFKQNMNFQGFQNEAGFPE